MNPNALPPGWAWATIPDLVTVDGVFVDGDWVESKDQDPEGDVRLIQLADVGDGVYLDRSNRFLTSNKARELRCTFLEPGDALIARMPDPLGRACIFPGDQKKSVTVVDVCIVRTGGGGVNHRWLMWAINSPDFRVNVAAKQSGSTRKRISRSNLATLPLPVPPLGEQQRTAEEIEKQVTRLEEAVEALKRVRVNLKRYRASVLKAACEGRLVPTEAELARAEGRDYEPADELLTRILKERRARREADQLAKMRSVGKPPKDDKWKARYKEPAMLDSTNLPSIPEGWAWATVEQLAAFEPNSLTDGPFGSNLKTSHYTQSGPRVVRLQNIGDGIFIDEYAHISEEHFKALAKHRIEAGDIVIAALGERPPRACVIPSYVGPAIVKADCIRFKPSPAAALAGYLNCALNAVPTRDRMADVVHGVGRPRLNLGEIKAIALPMPPLTEQQRIVTEVERHVSVIDELEAVAEANLKRAERLRQAILKRAFEGKLVPQDQSDEPAGVLLERIRDGKSRGTVVHSVSGARRR
jgi:type I restriction enzyme S subunit